MNCSQTPISTSRKYLTLAWKNMEARDFMKASKRRRSAVEMDETTKPTGDVSYQASQQIASTSRESYEQIYSGGSFLGPMYVPAYGGHFSNYHQKASYSTKTWSIPGNDSQTRSDLTQECFEKQNWETVSSKEERRHHKYERDHHRDDHPRNSKSYKPHHNAGHKNNKTDEFGIIFKTRR